MADIFGSGNRKDKWVKKATEWINYLFNNKSDTLVAGENITLTPDSTNHTVTVASTASGGASSLADLTDVDIDNPSDGQALVYDDGDWVNAPLPSAPVTDVQVDGTSVVNASGVAEIDLSGYAQTSDIPTKVSDLQNDSGFITTETDPTVPSWAKASTKPSYTASEVGAIPTTDKGVANGVASLGSDGKVPSSELPSYVDDVLEYASKSAFPATGESGKIYIALDTNKTYRWSGSAYVEISESLALGTNHDTAYYGDYGNTAYEHATDANKLTTATTSGLYKVASTNKGHIASLEAVQKSDITALGIPAQDTTYSDATTSAHGLMSATDKTKLDGIASGAEVNVNADWNATSGDAEILNKPTKLSDFTNDVVNNGTLTITQNGTTIGDFTANQSNSETLELKDEKVKITSTNPESATSYYPTWVDGSGTKGVNANNGLMYRTREGTTEQVGAGILTLGNSTASGTDKNKKGTLRLYGEGTYYTDVVFDSSATANRTQTFPNAGGILLNTGNFFAEEGYLKAVRSIVTCENANSFEAGWRRFAKVTVGSYGTAIIAFRGGWSSNRPYVGAVLLSIRNDNAKLRIIDGFCSTDQVHQKLRAARISANNYYLELYRSATSNANSAQYCDIIPLGGNASSWTVSETSSTPPINNNPTDATYDYAISLIDEQFVPNETNTGYIGTANKAWKEGYINNLHGDVDGSATKLTKTESVLQTNQVPYVSRASLSPEGFSGYVREMLVGGSVGWNQNIYNGNFANTNGWTISSTETATTSNNVITLTANTASVALDIYPNTVYRKAWQVGHKILATLDARTDTTGLKISASLAYGTVTKNKIKINFSLTSSWQTISNIVNITEATVGIRIAHANSSAVAVGDTYQVRNVYAVDLTLLLGTEIADYVYSLESATAGSGLAWLRSYGLFTKPYYAYDAGSIQSVCTNAKKIVGFNQWDEEWELGNYNASGQPIAATDRIRTKNYISVLPNTDYYFYCATASVGGLFYLYNANKEFISSVEKGRNTTFTTPQNACYLRFRMYSNYGTSYKNDICINISDTSKNGTYEPYHLDSIPLSPTELRGVPMLDSNNNLYFDGDEYTSDGKIKRRYGIVDAGTLTWYYNNGTSVYFYTTNLTDKAKNSNIICAIYNVDTSPTASMADKTIKGTTTDSRFYVKDSAYTDAATFKTAMSGVYLVYELATPTEETLIPFQNPQYSMGGSEEFVDYYVQQYDPEDPDEYRPFPIPCGHVTEYMGATSGKYQTVPTLPVNSGQYSLVTDGQIVNWTKPYITAGQRIGSTLGIKATAEGYYTTASGNYSHAEGYGTKAYGNNSHAEGTYSEATSYCAHAEGEWSRATSYCAHAEGEATTASGEFSHSEGNNTIASGKCSHAGGRYNVEDTNELYAVIIGNGTSTSNRSNALTLDWSGNLKATSYSNFSSRKYKENISDMTDEEAMKILQLNPVKYDYKSDKLPNNQYGLIAEDVEKIMTYPIVYEHGEADSIDYSKFVPALIKMIQIQQREIEALKNR